jgi:AAA15 family ATPase/GTPase
MVTELNIENFKLFEHLKVEGLKRVNLFAGKNNCGKTALLEALRIMAAGTDLTVMHHILNQRGQDQSDFRTIYDALFNRRTFESIKDINPIYFKINNFFVEKGKDVHNLTEYKAKINGKPYELGQLRNNLGLSLPVIKPHDVAVYIPFGSSEYFPLDTLWEKIVLTPKEDKVIEVLRSTILPDLIRLDVKSDRTLVRLKGEEKPMALKSLGDGAQRMLLIAIALVSAKDNLLLLDEIESGLHYSTIEKLWEIIFRYAEELNVQVFATTHSSDAIKTFAYVLEKPENKEKGAYYRMQPNRKTGEIEVVSYDLERLESALESNLETR